MWLELQIFGFRALWSPYFFAFVVLVGVLYFLFTGPKRNVFGEVSKPTRNQQIFFYSGLILLYLVKGGPIDLISHIMMSAHMIQMSVLFFIIPICLIRGLPIWIIERFIELPIVKPLFRFFTQTLIAVALFSSLFSMYHLPAIFDFANSSQLINLGITIILFILALTMWWPILTPLKTHDKLNPLIKMVYLLGSILMINIACALMIFGTKAIYSTYTSTGPWIQALSLCVPSDVLTDLSGSLSGPEMFSPLSAKEDQQLGGIIMMLSQQFIYGFVLSWIFFGWFSKKNMGVDPMPDSLPNSNYKE